MNDRGKALILAILWCIIVYGYIIKYTIIWLSQ